MTRMNHIARAAAPFAALACSMALFLSMTACGAAPSVSSEAASALSVTAATAEPAAESSPSPSPAEPSAPQETQSAPTLTLEDAKAAALEDAGFSETEVTILKAVQEYENGLSVYDIEFLAGDVEYDYEIETATGEIYSKKAETRQAGTTTPVPSAAQISEEDAKAIALEHAGLTDSDVTFTKTKLDRDDGQPVYEIEFRQGSTEYEYEIHSETGAIVKSDMERHEAGKGL